jgi:hypothetical protein
MRQIGHVYNLLGSACDVLGIEDTDGPSDLNRWRP